ncbi:modification methylase [Thermoplasma volcanium GSS1]|uniref:site-specific DNA-methyltransferase (adenine-specific) n=1 Tax=Thermoplasma volcanium (strain ATCC 51530 / DSM 4299 / JCM 9571 / NBRC 15438 / GSS1) TaxID=273116 RepID=Q97AX8_THEVO|nr:modification methylase [Thermoplasma volcanium GSS1]
MKQQEFPLSLLKEQKIIPPKTTPKKVLRLFNNDLLDIVVIEVNNDEFSRGRCVSIARSWKRNNLLSPVIVLTNSSESYVCIIPGVGYNSEAKILYLSDELYHTDKIVLKSMKYVENNVELLKLYNSEFFPYQKVRDDFFYQYRDLFQELSDKLTPYLEDHTRSFAQKFLGRLMFLYFLQKKGWLKGNKRFVDNIKDYWELSNLYYNGLNTGKIEGIPFLNGSLFDREDYLTRDKEEEISEILNEAFLRARKFFDDYNFTVDESAPLEVEVSIDPALIGTVFENLLLEKERGEKGTFYTPKDEISFICRRALVRYLGLQDRYTPDSRSLQDGIDLYLDELRKSKKLDEIRNLKERLLKVRVVDPAVGSGGFLVVMMQEIVSIVTEADSIAGWISDPYEYKKTIYGNIYGFDIEPEAVEIARLRMWLSMIIDLEVPVPLPNLDFKIVDIPDSLELQSVQKKITPEIEEERDHVEKLIEQYSNEHDHENKKSLKKRIESHTENLRKYGLNPEVIERYMVNPADIVVMNPPYVRQESIKQERKKYYVSTYKLDKKSDLYVYFFMRSLWLLKPNGYVSAITSDKWLETSYGKKLQDFLKSRLIAIYGQKNRSFMADINTVISLYGNDMQNGPVDFIYLESYASKSVVRRVSMERSDLKPGKWFYLRSPEIFLREIMPKLNHKLGDFAEVKRGFTTGANEFFYMRDVSSQYETDYLANPKKFEEWGVSAKNEKELKEQGLVYIENEGGERFVINRSDTKPLVRTTKDLKGYIIDKPERLCLYTKTPGIMTKKYIEWGRKQPVNIRGRKEPVIGYNNVPSVSGRKNWYSLNDLEPANIILPMYVMDRFFIPWSKEPVVCDNTFYTLKPNVRGIITFLNSTIFYTAMELYLRRLGGGVGEVKVNDYEQMPVPDLSKLDLSKIDVSLNRDVKRYFEEIGTDDRKKLDSEILNLLGVSDFPIDEFYKEFIDLVDDRLIKADRGLKSQEEDHDQDN